MFVVLFKKWSVLASVSALPACNVCFNHVFYTAANVRNRFVQPFQFVLWIKLMCDSAWNVRLVWVAGTTCSGCVWFLFCTEWKRIHLQLRGLQATCAAGNSFVWFYVLFCFMLWVKWMHFVRAAQVCKEQVLLGMALCGFMSCFVSCCEWNGCVLCVQLRGLWTTGAVGNSFVWFYFLFCFVLQVKWMYFVCAAQRSAINRCCWE